MVLTVHPEGKVLSWLLSFSFAHCPQHWHFCLVENSAGARGPGRRHAGCGRCSRSHGRSGQSPSSPSVRVRSALPGVHKPARVCSPLEESCFPAVAQSLSLSRFKEMIPTARCPKGSAISECQLLGSNVCSIKALKKKFTTAVKALRRKLK